MVEFREHLLDRIAGVGVADDPGERPEDGPVDRDEDDDAHEGDRDLTGVESRPRETIRPEQGVRFRDG